MYLPFWSEQKSWYRLVLTHELTHWVTFKALHRKLSFLGQADLATVPRWFYEGLAQYFAENWNLFRGDYFVKQALLSGQLNANAISDLNHGRLLYAAANGFVRYLSFTYGDSALIRLLQYNPKGWYFDFDKAFKAIFKQDVPTVFSDFIRSSVLYYGSLLADLPVASFPLQLPDFLDRTTDIIQLSARDSLYLVSGFETSDDISQCLFIVRMQEGHTHILQRISDRLGTQVCLSRDHRYVAYGEPFYSVESDQQALRFQWFVFDRKREKIIKILEPLRCRYATFGENHHLILAEVLPNGSRLLQFDVETQQVSTILRSSAPVGHLTSSPDGTLFFSRQTPKGQRELCSLKDGRLRVLTSLNMPRSPVCLNKRFLAFNETRAQQLGLALYDLRADSVISRWQDQYAYWLSSADSSARTFTVYRYDSQGKRHFFSIPLDSLFTLSSRPLLLHTNRYGKWRSHAPFLADTLQIPTRKMQNIKPKKKHTPFFPMEHLFSFAMPFYDRNYGYGFYGTTLWLEILQRQILSAAFWLTPLHPDRSIFLVNHQLKWFNSDISTYVYYGPVILTHPLGTRRQINFSIQRFRFIHGQKRARLFGKVAYSYFDHQFKKNAPYPTHKIHFHGPSFRIGFRYLMPSLRGMAIPKRRIEFDFFYFNTMPGSNYQFHLLEFNSALASKLFLDDLGFVDRFSFIRQQGHLLPFQIVGIDRYYEFDMPRDYLFTRTIRGFRQNIDSDQLLWNSFELRYFVRRSTPYKLIFLPIGNVTVDGFFDYARLNRTTPQEIASIGIQCSFGDRFLRFSAGYARTYRNWDYHSQVYFGRISVLLNDLQ